MKKFWIVFGILAVATGIYFLEKKNSVTENSTVPVYSAPENNQSLFASNDSPDAIRASAISENSISQTGFASLAASPGSMSESKMENENKHLPPLTILDKARVTIHNYNAAFGENPIGTNPEITAALMGNNPKQINFITAESGLTVNDKGEMVDAYGTPFFFHQLSGHEMEIRSAGEDKKMWTFDDPVTR